MASVYASVSRVFFTEEGSPLYRVVAQESTTSSRVQRVVMRTLKAISDFWLVSYGERYVPPPQKEFMNLLRYGADKMNKSRAVNACRRALAQASGVIDDGFVLPVLLIVLMFTLSGCGVKNLSIADSLFSTGSGGSGSLSNQQRPGTGYLPADTGIALRPAEMSALLSVGDFDRNLSSDEMRDVVLHFKSLVQKNRKTVAVNVERGRAYVPHIRQALREKRLPQDLAYLPFVESGYNTGAKSSSNAAGMWQFIPNTGKHYGMAQNGWIDERRDPFKATRGAVTYLDELNRDLDDWHLAISAYNAGPGKIKRGLAATNAKTFFELRDRDNRISSSRDKMTDENKQYLPKFLAVCKIMRNLDTLGFPSVDGPGLQVAELRVNPGTDLMTLSKSIGLSWRQFAEYNPAMLRYVSPADRTSSVYVPPHLERNAQAFLSKPQPRNNRAFAGVQPAAKKQVAAQKASSRGTVYQVQAGDSLWGIARKFNVPPMTLLAHNNLDRSTVLRPGDTVRVP